MTLDFLPDELKEFHRFEHDGWESVSGLYGDCWEGLTNAFVPALIEAVAPLDGVRLLDLATGLGYAADAARSGGAAATGLDFSASMIDRARARYPEVRFLQGDVHRLPLEDGEFDAAVVNFGVQHFADLQRAFSEIARVLRPGGRLALTIWADGALNEGAGVLERALDAHAARDSRVPRGPSYLELCDDRARIGLLRSNGFDAESVSTRTVRVDWQVPSADHLYWAEHTASVRSGARLREQDEATARRIRSDMAADVERRYLRDGVIRIPMAAHVVAARRL
ncbi:class I SAM-dependent methyltransferase [Azospirillum thermophilum]|uniref:Methyltransferase type 11 domain-containing protein n=1 Tax=Azospirillum thermophilum TaxID=2202148 RepID=A0A2S2CUN4_9PROT|nr:class I SAM-dependent methyltransferase [Azospirillum thermophilum]AWK88198.1 hypothetical protein DEW08_18975 [Azospirillum thermophilum]